MKKTEGIRVRHSRRCRTTADKDATCNCQPSYRAVAWDPRTKTRVRKTFRNMSEARAWRHDAVVALRRGTMRAPTSTTVREAATALMEGMDSGAVRTRSGDVFKPSTVRSYRAALSDRIVKEFGAVRLGDLRRSEVQDFADGMLAEGLDPSTIRNVLMPLRVIYRRALVRGEIAVNPTTGLELPAVRGRRDRIASPGEAARLLAALELSDRALWATAFYAGLRRGELRGLRWGDVDLGKGVINVERSMDERGSVTAPKSHAGRRSVPIATVLRELLIEHRLASGRAEGYVFGPAASRPFTPTAVRRRALTAWKRANKKESSAAEEENRKPDLLAPIGLHEARHTFASLMIAAGVNVKALSAYMGHASIGLTLDTYGHLLPGNEDEATALLDAYLTRAAAAVQLAQAD